MKLAKNTWKKNNNQKDSNANKITIGNLDQLLNDIIENYCKDKV